MQTEDSTENNISLLPKDCVRCKNLFFALNENDFINLILIPKLNLDVKSIKSIKEVDVEKLHELESILEDSAKKNKL